MNEELTQNSMQNDVAQEIDEVKHQYNFNEEDYGENLYFQKNPEMFKYLMLYIKHHPISCCKVISRKYNQKYLSSDFNINDFIKWIYESTIFLDKEFDFEVKFQTRIYCIFHGITSLDQFPHCKTCNKAIKQNAYTFVTGFTTKYFCSAYCRANNEEFKAKNSKMRTEKYGNVFGPIEKINKTKHEKYGNDCFKIIGKKASITKRNFSKERKHEIELKKQKTSFKNYGTKHPAQNVDLRRKCQKKYIYNNIHFDSFIEIAIYIWNKDHNIQFEYQPNISFEYMHNGKTHKYIPDFRVENQLIEIKGDHFFKEDGTMQNPYNHSQDDLYEAKHQCMIKNNIIIMRSFCYNGFLKYVNEKYGSDLIKKCKQ